MWVQWLLVRLVGFVGGEHARQNDALALDLIHR